MGKTNIDIVRGFMGAYHRIATWDECTICRVQDGRTIEGWSTEDRFCQMKQLESEIREPQAEHAG